MPQKITHEFGDDVTELLMAIYITNRRTNDLLARMLFNLDRAAAIEMMQDHEKGAFFTPELAMLVGEDGTGE